VTLILAKDEATHCHLCNGILIIYNIYVFLSMNGLLAGDQEGASQRTGEEAT